MTAPAAEFVRQHLIDPEVCIRCNTCQEMCPIDAIEHDAKNYVVKFEVCNWCNDCMAPCPTGAIDNARMVAGTRPYSLTEQYAWNALPDAATAPSPVGAAADASAAGAAAAALAHTPDDRSAAVVASPAAASGIPALAPWSAAHPYVNLYAPAQPITATVMGNHRLTAADAASDIRHVVLDFGSTPFPVLEGQAIGIVPPGLDTEGRPLPPRQYSVASPREGERPGYNNLALTVKRVTTDHQGQAAHGLCSNYVCDLKKGDRVQVTGPYGTTFLMPNHPGSSLLMICTGTGAAPMRAMTERRRRRMALGEGGGLTLFFGARAPDELPYFGPLQKLPPDFIDIHLAFSRLPDQPKRYVQDLLREQAGKVAHLLADDDCYIYICGLKGMESGVVEALRDICRGSGQDWDTLYPELRRKARFHIETY